MNSIQISFLVAASQALLVALWCYRQERKAIAQLKSTVASSRVSLRQSRESLERLQENYRDLLEVVTRLGQNMSGAEEELINLYLSFDEEAIRQAPVPIQLAWEKGRELHESLSAAAEVVEKVTSNDQA